MLGSALTHSATGSFELALGAQRLLEAGQVPLLLDRCRRAR